MTKFLFHPAFFLIFVLFISVKAQNKKQNPDSLKTYELSDVVVTATKTATPLYELASSVSVIDSLTIARSNKINVLELLKNQYGLTMSQSGGPGQITQLFMRGANDGSVLVVIDGVKMNMPDDPNASYDFGFLPVDNIERIEVLRGPQSTLYGSDAMAGVINIITKSGSGKARLFFNTEGGSLNTYRGMIGTRGSKGTLDYSITLSKYKSRGVSAADEKFGNTEPDGFENYNLNSKIGWQINSNVRLNLFTGFNKGKIDLDQFGGKYGDDPTYAYDHEQGAYNLETDVSLLDGRLEQKFNFSFMRDLRRFHFAPSQNNPGASSASYYQGNSFRLGLQNNFKVSDKNTATLGIEANKDISSSDYLYLSQAFGNYKSTLPESSTKTIGVFLQDQFNLDNIFFSTIGLRYDNNDRFGSAVTFRIAATYIISKTSTKIKAVYGTGFKAPSLFSLYDPNYGNVNLKPEKSKGWEAGIEQYFDDYNFTVGITYFRNIFTDLIGYDNNLKTININKAKTNGVEVYLSTNSRDNLNIDFNYTYTNTINESPGSADKGLPLLRRPKHKASLKLSYSFLEDLTTSIEELYVGKRDDKDFSFFPARRIIMSDYTLLNFSASYKINSLVQVYGRVENIFDKSFEDVFGYGTIGRAGYAGIRLNIE